MFGRKKVFSHEANKILISVVGIILFIGILMIASASSSFSERLTGNSFHYLLRQIYIGLLPGVTLAFIISKFSLNFFKRFSFLFLVFSIFLCALVFIPQFQYYHGGAVRWLKFGTITLQPAEFAKIATIVYLAAFFARKKKENKIKSLEECLLPLLSILLPFAILFLLQPDMGSFGIICFIALFMYFSSGGSLLYTGFLITLGIIAFVVLSFIAPYRFARITAFLNPEVDPQGIGYHLNQNLITIGSGGILGLGYGNSIQKFGYLPQAMEDSIFAIWGEETGFIGCVALLFLYLILIWRGIKICQKLPDDFEKNLACGIVSWIAVQTFINIGGVAGLIPLTGIPLPLISYGGTALIAALIAMGILINISKKTV